MVDIDDDTLRSGGPESAFANVEPIFDASDLPDGSGDEYHNLGRRDGSAFLIADSFETDKGLKLGTMTPVLGWHGGISQITYTGDAAAIKADGNPVFMDALGIINAGAGQTFDISASAGVEHLVNECTFVGGGLGTIDGYRVPAFKTCNFEMFSSGLTFTGSPDKVIVDDCPLRNIMDSGVTALTFDSNLDVDTVAIKGSYVQGVQSDTVVVDVQSGAMPSDVFKYSGNDHDTATVTESNILTGQAGIEQPGFKVTDSYPLRNSGAGGEYSLTSPPATTTISSADTPTKVEGATTARNPERFSLTADNEFTYTGKSGTEKEIVTRLSLSATNTTVSVYIALNGTPLGDGALVETQGSSTPVTVTEAKRIDVEEGDTLEVQIANVDGTGDITVDRMSVVV